MVATESGQQMGKRVQATIAMTMPDVKPEMAMGMIMPHCSPGFFPGTKVFMNVGALANGLPIHDWARYAIGALCS